MVYVEPDGKVSKVDVIQSTGNADDIARATLAQWEFHAPGERIRGIVRVIVDLKR
jgi:outer membrane biosynthesis protein TonB